MQCVHFGHCLSPLCLAYGVTHKHGTRVVNEGGMTHGLPQQVAVTSSLTNQWHPNIIAFDKSTTGYGQQTKKASSASPYLSPQPLSKKAKAGTASARGAGSQRSQSVTSMSGNGKNSGRSQSLPPAHASHVCMCVRQRACAHERARANANSVARYIYFSH